MPAAGLKSLLDDSSSNQVLNHLLAGTRRLKCWRARRLKCWLTESSQIDSSCKQVVNLLFAGTRRPKITWCPNFLHQMKFLELAERLLRLLVIGTGATIAMPIYWIGFEMRTWGLHLVVSFIHHGFEFLDLLYRLAGNKGGREQEQGGVGRESKWWTPSHPIPEPRMATSLWSIVYIHGYDHM